MKTFYRNTILFTCAFLPSLVCLADAPFFPKLVVSGSAVLHKPADQVSLSMSVITQAKSAQEALAGNNASMQKVIDKLLVTGLEKGEYHTEQFSIRPVHSLPPRNPPSDWKAEIVAYEVSNNLQIKTKKMDLAAKIIDAAGKAGIDQIANISFSLNDPQMYRSEAITLAATNAMRDAQALAAVANLELVRIVDVKLDQPQIYSRPGPNLYYMAKAESAPVIEAPDVDLSANVTVTFEIAGK